MIHAEFFVFIFRQLKLALLKSDEKYVYLIM